MAMPAVQLWDGILLLPLVGEIDSHRASMLMDSALSAITKHAARVVIIDITGVPFVDSHVASSLIRTVQAARLLGSRVCWLAFPRKLRAAWCCWESTCSMFRRFRRWKAA